VKLVGNNEMAKLLGMSPQAFAKGIRQGRFTSSGKSGSGKPLYNPEKVMQEYKATVTMAEMQDGAAMLPNELKGGRPSGADMSGNSEAYLKAKTANEALKAQLQKLKFELQSGKLIEKETARKQGAELGVRMMGIIDSWPARMAPEFASMKNADEHDFHQKLIREANILKQEIISICAVTQNKM
jgi:phage terminase Nu1 subunit (DNA packaging protein)